MNHWDLSFSSDFMASETTSTFFSLIPFHLFHIVFRDGWRGEPDT
jgi:heme/copper-type cytochrome/quinol oxidase subunit 3